jgi:hypothetical protein
MTAKVAAKRKPPRHPWYFSQQDIRGRKTKSKPHWAKKRYYKGKPFTLELTLQMALDSKKANGAGNSQRCPGAFCVHDSPDEIPFKFSDPVYVDWLLSRLVISTKVNNLDFPTECIEMEHHQPWFAKKNDDPSGKGIDEIISYIREHGPIRITCHPIKSRAGKAPQDRRPEGQHNRARSGNRGRGPARRYADFARGLTL